MRREQVSRRLPWAVLASLAVLISVVSGCGEKDNRATGADGPPTTLPSLAVNASPERNATDVPLDADVAISVGNARLTEVIVSNAAGAALEGSLDPATGLWKSASKLAATTTYNVQATATFLPDRVVTDNWTFTTLTPAKELKARVSPVNGATVGVGHPLAVYLTAPVEDKAALASRLQVATTPEVLGAWRWFSNTELHWRPEKYWATGTKVTLTADLAGWNAGNGVWGVEDRKISFNIGDAHISTVDAATHQMTVTKNGEVVKTFPISTGRAKYPTKSGIHVINGRDRHITMDSASAGITGDTYSTEVEWAVRISNSGEFVHAAPWSVGSQGRANVSHGCVNASTANASWFFKFSQLGDVVNVINTPVQIKPTNGFGDWNIPWAEWAN